MIYLYVFSIHDVDVQGRYMHDVYDLAHVAGWEPYNLHDLGHVSWVGRGRHRSCTASHYGRLDLHDVVDRGISHLPVQSVN